MSFQKWTKILPFCILKHLDTVSNRQNPVWINFFDGWDYHDEAKYKEIKADISIWFPGTFVFTSEKYELEEQKEGYEKKLKCVNERLRKC